MRRKKAYQYILTILASIGLVSCSGGPSSGGDSGVVLGNYSVVVTGSNVMTITVSGCGFGNINQLCGSVKICTPGSTSQCQTIDRILIDTGSYGLRIFSSVVTVSLNSVTTGNPNNYQISECAQFGSANTWGPVKTADVTLASGEIVSSLPIQLIDASYANVPSPCQSTASTPLATSPATSYWNGILGVGLLIDDCALCTTIANNQVYYSCTGSTSSAVCTNVTLPSNQHVLNPVGRLSTDNQGVIVYLPAIPSAGAASVSGALIFGIGTQANNTPGTVTTFPASATADFRTRYNGTTYTNAFIDSGSNGLFFPGSGIADCSPANGFYCPASPQAATAVQIGNTGSPQGSVNFEIASVNGTSAYAMNNIGGAEVGLFDWGLPFFFGRKIYVGLQSATTSLGTGPYWAY